MRIFYDSAPSSNFVTLVVATFIGVLMLPGCTAQVEIAPPNIPVADIEPLPAEVGVFYSKSLASVAASGPRAPPLGQSISYVAGPALIKMFDTALNSTFQKVVQLQSWPSPDNPPDGLDAMIQPSIVEFRAHGASPVTHCGLESLVDFYLPDGEPLDSWRLSSSYSIYLKPYHMSESAPYKSVDKSLAEECVHIIMRDITAQFIAESADRPALKAWLKSIEDR